MFVHVFPQICLVLASVVAVIIYRVIAREDLFRDRGEIGPLMASVTSTFINTCSIMIMGKVCALIFFSKTTFSSSSFKDIVLSVFTLVEVNNYFTSARWI